MMHRDGHTHEKNAMAKLLTGVARDYARQHVAA